MGARGDREQERAELAGLHAELLEQKDWIERAIATDEYGAAAVQQLIRAAETAFPRAESW